MSKTWATPLLTRTRILSVGLLLVGMAGVSWGIPRTSDVQAHVAPAPPLAALPTDEGIRFSCKPEQLDHISAEMSGYFATLRVPRSLVVSTLDKQRGTLVYTLNTLKSDVTTLDFAHRPAMNLTDDLVTLPAPGGRERSVATVSKKEILLALMQHGRLTEFKGAACHVQALQDHVAVRQNIVAWSEKLAWDWPNGGSARWNTRYWTWGTPRRGVPVHAALNDAFWHQNKYAIGCYTATKLVVVQGVLDYYRRIKGDPVQAAAIEARLQSDADPLVAVEPGRMWHFEEGITLKKLRHPGKLVRIGDGVAPRNFVPGDWVYFLNTDARSAQKTGYEGSNAIYMGRDKFDDYYADNAGGYTYAEKLDEVYQWQHGVFSRSRDFAKIRPLASDDFDRLSQTPEAGGLLLSIRVTPYLFGFEDLPAI